MKHALNTVWLLIRRTAHEYGEDNCSHMAAAISYYILFSIVPLAIFTISMFGLVVRDSDVQDDVADEIVDFLSLRPDSIVIEPNDNAITERYGPTALEEIALALSSNGLTRDELLQLADTLEQGGAVEIAGRSLTSDELVVKQDSLIADTVKGVSTVSGALWIVGLVGMAWSASAMFGAIRRSLNIAWDVEYTRPVVQQKAVDLVMVGGLGVLLALSIAGTTAIRVVRELSEDNLGPLSTGTGFVWSVAPLFLPAVFSFLVFLLIYRYVPSAKTTFGDVWPGALFATVSFELLKNGFAFYIAKFNNYDIAYGALGGVLLFMLWAYLTSNVLLIGAEVASEYPRVMAGHYEEPQRPKPAEEASLPQKALRFAKGLFVQQRESGR